MKFQFIKRVAQGEMCPAWYGIYREDMMHREVLVMPMPFNVIFGILGALCSSIRWSYVRICISQRDAYEQGYQAGMARFRMNFNALSIIDQALRIGMEEFDDDLKPGHFEKFKAAREAVHSLLVEKAR